MVEFEIWTYSFWNADWMVNSKTANTVNVNVFVQKPIVYTYRNGNKRRAEKELWAKRMDVMEKHKCGIERYKKKTCKNAYYTVKIA